MECGHVLMACLTKPIAQMEFHKLWNENFFQQGNVGKVTGMLFNVVALNKCWQVLESTQDTLSPKCAKNAFIRPELVQTGRMHGIQDQLAWFCRQVGEQMFLA